jgi:hypothetical protein
MSLEEEGKRPHCEICGRFMRAVTWPDPETKKARFVRWQCIKVSDDGCGVWEHN